MAHLIKCTNEEARAIEELKKRTFHDLSPSLQKDETLYYRFLKARDFNVQKAEEMLRKHLADRKIFDAERIHQHYDPPNNMEEYTASSFIGFSKEGNVVRYIDIGGSDFKGYVHTYDYKQLCQYVSHYFNNDMKLMVEQSKKLGKPITKHITIINFDKLSLFQATYKRAIDYGLKGFKMYQINYPERVRAIYVINASIHFHILYAVIKNILSAELVKKIHIFGRTGWQEELLKLIDADVLPAFLGGKRTDPDGNTFCNSFIVHGKKIPENMYKSKRRKSLAHTDVKVVTIPRSSTHEIKLVVDDPDTQIEWEFESQNGDIGFALLHKDASENDDKLEEVIPNHRVDTELSPEQGIYECYKAGTYIVVFDNSYSWFTSKEVIYKISSNVVKNNNLQEN